VYNKKFSEFTINILNALVVKRQRKRLLKMKEIFCRLIAKATIAFNIRSWHLPRQKWKHRRKKSVRTLRWI